ncbi:MAG: PAS domain S-box protein, partial [Lysobacteraceae bacterium]
MQPGLARDLMQDRYNRVFKRTLEVMMLALPVMLWLSWERSGNAAETLGLAVLTGLAYALYPLLRTGVARWVPALLVAVLILFSTWDILAYGSVRTAGTVGYFCAVVAAGIMMRRRTLVGVLLLCMSLLGALVWAEMTGLLHRSGFQMQPIYWVGHVIALVGAAIGTGTSRQLVQRALRDLQSEVDLRTHAEAERAQSEQQLRRVFELSPAGILVQSVATRRALDLNPAFERIFGYSRAEYLGMAEHTPLWMDTRQRDAMVVELLEKGYVTNREILARRRDGTPFNALVSSEIGGSGTERIVVSTISDISAEVEARRAMLRSQELFTKAFDFSPLNMLISRMSDGRVLAVNSAQNTVQGYTREDMLGRTTTELQSWEDESQRLAFMDRLRRDGQ